MSREKDQEPRRYKIENDFDEDSDSENQDGRNYIIPPNENKLNESWKGFRELLKSYLEHHSFTNTEGYRNFKNTCHWVVSNLRAKQKSYFMQQSISCPTQHQINEFYRELTKSAQKQNYAQIDGDDKDDNNQFNFQSYLDLIGMYEQFKKFYENRVMGDSLNVLEKNYKKYEEKKIKDAHLLFASIPGIHVIHAIVYCVNYWKELTRAQEVSPLTVIKVGATFFGLLLAPALDFLIIPYLIYDFVSSTVQYVKIKEKHEGRLEEYGAPMDELKGVFERLIACFPDHEANDIKLLDEKTTGQIKPADLREKILHRDEFVSLLLGEKFESTNSTGIINIQNQLKQYPDMSSDRLFYLLQTEISRRVSQSGSMVSLFKEANRVPAMQKLYNLVNGGRFGTGQKLDLTQHNDRERLLSLMRKERSFVKYETLETQEDSSDQQVISPYFGCSAAKAAR